MGDRDSDINNLGDRECPHRWCVGAAASLSLCPRPPPDYDERSHLHDSFTQMTHSLQEVATAQGEWVGTAAGGDVGLEPPRDGCVLGICVSLEHGSDLGADGSR